MTRKQFIESHGATCRNWTWSWSFINEDKKIIIFGAWDILAGPDKALILSDEWAFNGKRKSPSYGQSRQHIRLIEEEGYRLKTFVINHSDAKKDAAGLGPAQIDGFEEKLISASIAKIGNSWYAVYRGDSNPGLAEELPEVGDHYEGAKKSVVINAYERSASARSACIAHHGASCAVCGFNFKLAYGEAGGTNFIHVHHVVPIGSIGKEYQVNPITDLIPVCPNCHAVIHLANPPLTVEQLRSHIITLRENGI